MNIGAIEVHLGAYEPIEFFEALAIRPIILRTRNTCVGESRFVPFAKGRRVVAAQA